MPKKKRVAITVTSSKLVRDARGIFELLQRESDLTISITLYGDERAVIISPEEHDRLMTDRRTMEMVRSGESVVMPKAAAERLAAYDRGEVPMPYPVKQEPT